MNLESRARNNTYKVASVQETSKKDQGYGLCVHDFHKSLSSVLSCQLEFERNIFVEYSWTRVCIHQLAAK